MIQDSIYILKYEFDVKICNVLYLSKICNVLRFSEDYGYICLLTPKKNYYIRNLEVKYLNFG